MWSQHQHDGEVRASGGANRHVSGHPARVTSCIVTLSMEGEMYVPHNLEHHESGLRPGVGLAGTKTRIQPRAGEPVESAKAALLVSAQQVA